MIWIQQNQYKYPKNELAEGNRIGQKLVDLLCYKTEKIVRLDHESNKLRVCAQSSSTRISS